MRVRIYWNLHRKAWSVKALHGPHAGRVICHASEVWLTDVKPVVSEAGPQRALRERRKNVHAYLDGDLSAVAVEAWRVPATDINRDAFHVQWGYIRRSFEEFRKRAPGNFADVSYNPYKAGHFVADGREFTGAFQIGAWDRKVVALLPRLVEPCTDITNPD